MLQKYYIMQGQYWGPKNITRYGTKYTLPRDLTLAILQCCPTWSLSAKKTLVCWLMMWAIQVCFTQRTIPLNTLMIQNIPNGNYGDKWRTEVVEWSGSSIIRTPVIRIPLIRISGGLDNFGPTTVQYFLWNYYNTWWWLLLLLLL
jgi:hypothetical protein